LYGNDISPFDIT
jgi:hypothetical protein